MDNALISERKLGLSAYLNGLLSSSPFKNSPVLATFLKTSSTATTGEFSLEDALPSTLTRAAALNVQKQLAKSGEGEIKAAATPIAAAYYPDWSADSIPPESLDYSRFDVLFFGLCLLLRLSTQADGLTAFATPNSSNGLSWDDGATSILQRLVKSARNSGKGTKIVLSIGMFSMKYWWTSSTHVYSTRRLGRQLLVLPSDELQQPKRVRQCRCQCCQYVRFGRHRYRLGMFSITWERFRMTHRCQQEYPNESGAGNPHSSSDAANLLSFFTSLRSSLGSSKIISAAVTCLPWVGSNGSPLTNVASYAAQLTYANIMNYDTWVGLTEFF